MNNELPATFSQTPSDSSISYRYIDFDSLYIHENFWWLITDWKTEKNLPLHMNRGFFCCVGLSMVTSDGLAGRLQWRAISPAMNVHRSEVVLLLRGALKRASRKVWRSVSKPKEAGGATPGGGDIFRGLGDNLWKILGNELEPPIKKFFSNRQK